MRATLSIAVLLVMLAANVGWSQRSGFVYHEIQVYDELGRKVTDITALQVNTGASAQTIYQDQLLNTAITNPMGAETDNTTLASGFAYWYGTDAFNVSITSTLYGSATYAGLNASVSRVILPTYWAESQSQTVTDAQSITLGTDADWVLAAGATAGRFTATPSTADTYQFWVGSTNYPADLYLFGATSGYNVYWDASEDTLEILDNVTVAVGTGDDFTIIHNGSTTNFGGAYTSDAIATFATDAFFDGTYDIQYDDSRSQLTFLDNAVLAIGGIASAAGDVAITWDGGSFNIVPALVDTLMELGDATTGFDVHYYFEDAGEIIVDFDGDFLDFTDDMEVRFGTGASADGDFAISSNSSGVLQIEQVVTDTGSVTWGATGAGMDQTWYGEEAGDYMMWDGTGASQLILHGADSSGTMLAIAAIDTTGNTDTMTIAHSGTGDALQITCTEADSAALNLIAATSQTTSVLKVDGATGSWLGADDVGMINITNDGALAHVDSSLLRIANSGVPQNDSRGSSLRIVDTGNAAAGTAGYAVYISATDATVEALLIDDGNVLVDEHITCTGGVQSASVTVTADTEVTQVTIPAGTRFASIAITNGATDVVCLPAAVIGNVITITVPATGCELQTLATSNATINGVDCDGSNEMAMAATSVYQLTCVAADTWIAYGWGADGAAQATIVPDTDS